MFFKKCVIGSVLAFSGFNCFANVSLNLKDVPAIDFLKQTYLGILGVDYILDPDLNGTKKLNLSVSNVSETDFKKIVDSSLEKVGIYKSQINGITYFSSKSEDKVDQVETYDFTLPAVPGSVLTNNVPSPLPLDFSSGSGGYIDSQGSSEFEIYKPKNRKVENLQTLANSLLGTSVSPVFDRVILRGYDKKQISKVLEIIKKYDSEKPREIYLEAAILEFSENNENNRGFTLAASVLSDHLRIGINTILSPFDSFIGVSGSDINASLSILSYDNRFSLISAPKIRIFDGQTGVVNVGQSVPTLSETSISDGGTRSQSIQYRDSGVILRVTPSVQNDLIQLNISTELSNFIKTQTSGIDSPTLTRRALNTVLTLRNNEMVILGGLDENKKSQGTQGVWFLPKFMDSDLKSRSHSQILIVIQAKVI